MEKKESISFKEFADKYGHVYDNDKKFDVISHLLYQQGKDNMHRLYSIICVIILYGKYFYNHLF